MKKLLFSLLACMAFMPAISQLTTFSDAELSFGLETAFPRGEMAKKYNTGIGGSAKFAYNFTDKALALTFQAGAINFSGKALDSNNVSGLNKTNFAPMLSIPVKIGARFTFARFIYAEPQLGATVFLSENLEGAATSEAAFTWAFNLGFHTRPGIDIGARYESSSTEVATSFIGLRITYAFTFRRQEIY